MIFNSKEEAYKSRERAELVYDQSVSFSEHIKKFDFYEIEPIKTGQFFLYEITDYKHIHYPRLAVYLNSVLVDQALEIEYYDIRRSWEDRVSIISGNRHVPLPLFGSTISSVLIWSNSVLIYGVWDKKPTWRELKSAYQKTWWFRITNSQKRDRKIKSIING